VCRGDGEGTEDSERGAGSGIGGAFGDARVPGVVLTAGLRVAVVLHKFIHLSAIAQV